MYKKSRNNVIRYNVILEITRWFSGPCSGKNVSILRDDLKNRQSPSKDLNQRDAAVAVDLERVFIDAQANATKQSKITYCLKKLLWVHLLLFFLFFFFLSLTIALRRVSSFSLIFFNFIL